MAQTTIDLDLLNGTNGFIVEGASFGDSLGSAVAIFGDFNGHGLDDLAVSAPGGDPDSHNGAGEVYIIFGNNDEKFIDLGDLDGASFVRLDGINACDAIGETANSIGPGGDFNGNGIDDIIVGVRSTSPGGRSIAGEAFVIFGSDEPTNPIRFADFDLRSLNGLNGFRLFGGDPNSGLSNATQNHVAGRAVGSAGDFNGDGFGDVLVGAPGYGIGDGATFLIFGKANGFQATQDLIGVDGTDGIKFTGNLKDNIESRVAAAGDINGDGFDDFVTKAPAANLQGRSSAGSNYVIFGHENFVGAAVDIDNLDATQGFRIDGAQAQIFQTGVISGGGDFNGDGFDDLIIGGGGNDLYTVDNSSDVVTEKAGEGGSDRVNALADFVNPLEVEFLVGKFAAVGLTLTGNDQVNRITGANKINSPDAISGEGGNDKLVGLVGNVVINGGAGNDQIFGNSGADVIDGGLGNDVVSGQEGADQFGVGLAEARDTVTDFDITVDQMNLAAHGFADFAAILAATTDINGTATIALGGANLVRLQGVVEADLAADDFILIWPGILAA
jgi:Ca2+-binding RTX toxin-like protein